MEGAYPPMAADMRGHFERTETHGPSNLARIGNARLVYSRRGISEDRACMPRTATMI
jgi:hypothetical protein